MNERVLAGVAIALLSGCGSVDEAPPVDGSGQLDAGADGAPSVCPAGQSTVCANNSITTCDAAGNATDTVACAVGCNDGDQACKKIATSNGMNVILDNAAALEPLELVGDATIDTDKQTVTDSTGKRVVTHLAVDQVVLVPLFVVSAQSMTLGNVTVIGSRALVLVADGTIAISGHVSVSARGDIGGPGGMSCRPTTPLSNTEARAGGGGGGYGTPGGQGGAAGGGSLPVVAGGAAGGAAGNEELVPLRGGCPGAHSGGGDDSPQATQPDPGGAGGAVQIVSNRAIVIADDAVISANGGGGKGISTLQMCLPGNVCGFGEAGGSGGAILLEAPVISLGTGAGLYANGGGGSCAFGGSAQSGQLSATPAAGQVCATPNGSGGNGAAGAIAATSGVDRTGLDNAVGGGGGGGAGRIRVNVPNGSFSTTAVISPAATSGSLSAR